MSDANCGGKVRYPTKGKAEAAVRTIKRKGDKGTAVRPMRSYRCERCGKYHLSSNLDAR